MIDNNKKIIYDIMARGTPLTKTVLLRAGLTDNSIQKLIEDNFIIQIEPSKYELYTSYDLYNYGLELLSLKEVKKANACFQRCHQLNPNNRTFLLQLFLKSLKLKDYEIAQNRLSQIDFIEPEKHKHNNNLYIYLLNMIKPCNKTFKERINNMDYDSIFPTENNQEYHNKEMNNIRHLIMKFQYRDAMYILNRIIIEDAYSKLEQEVLKELMSQIITIEKEFKLLLLSYAKNKKYQQIVLLLKEKAKSRQLSNSDTYIKIICEKILSLAYEGIIPQISVTETTCLYEAIKGNNFAAAKGINDFLMQQCNSPLDNQIIDVLLIELNKMIHKIETENRDPKTKNITHIDYIAESQELAYYLQEEHISIEKAKKHMGLMQEQVLLIKLVYARDYYTSEMYLEGDTLIKEVERSQNKTTRVIKFLNEVRTNKKFYKNRINQYQKKRSLVK